MAKLNKEEKDFLLETETANEESIEELNRVEGFREEPKTYICPRCGKPLEEMNVPGFGPGYSHRVGKCKPYFEDEDAILKEKEFQQRLKEAEPKKEKTEINVATKKDEDKPFPDAVIIDEDESEDDIKKRLGLFDEKNDEKRDNPVFSEPPQEKPKKPKIEREPSLPQEHKKKEKKQLKVEKLKEKISVIESGKEDEVERIVSENAETPLTTRKAIIIRKGGEANTGKNEDKNVEEKDMHIENKEKSVYKASPIETSKDADDENLGKTQLLTPPEPLPEEKIYPTLTDIETGEIISIEQPETLIGRSKKCRIRISDNVISHEHAYLMLKNDKAYLRDDKSSNGTFIYENEDAEPFKLPYGLEVEIKDGCIIQFANIKYRFSMEG